MSTKTKVLDYIKNNSGMSASVSTVARALDPTYQWNKYSSFVAVIAQLKHKGLVKEIKGRYYA
jgi:hypothetical protein